MSSCDCGKGNSVKIQDAPKPDFHEIIEGVEGVEIGTEACPACNQNLPVRAGVFIDPSVGVSLVLTGFHLHSGICADPIILPPRFIRINDIEDLADFIPKLKDGFQKLGELVKANQERREEMFKKIAEGMGLVDEILAEEKKES